jgi:ribose 5-phosphate isomerase A
MTVGIGSGSTIVYAIAHLVERLRGGAAAGGGGEALRDIRCVPTSFQAKQLLQEGGVPIVDLSVAPVLDVAIDGADEVDGELNCIKGGGGCHTQEKMVAAAARVFVVVADFRKRSRALGTEWRKGVPLEGLPMAYVPVMRAVTAMGGKPVLRMAVAKAGPVVTDNGNFIVDADFGAVEPAAVAPLHARCKLLPGVLETGLFPGMAVRAYFGCEDGSVEVWDRPARKGDEAGGAAAALK